MPGKTKLFERGIVMKKTVGIVFADEMEYKPFEKAAEAFGAKKETFLSQNCLLFNLGELEIVAVESGIGKGNAAFAAASLILKKNAEIILNAGLSGAVSHLCRGDIVAGESFTECDFDLTAIGYELGAKPDGDISVHKADEELLQKMLSLGNIKKARFGTGDIFLSDSEKKRLFKEKFKIGAFDMETAAIALVCDKCSVPFLSLRKISDDADDSSGEDYRDMNNRAESCLTDILFAFFKII